MAPRGPRSRRIRSSWPVGPGPVSRSALPSSPRAPTALPPCSIPRRPWPRSRTALRACPPATRAREGLPPRAVGRSRHKPQGSPAPSATWPGVSSSHPAWHHSSSSPESACRPRPIVRTAHMPGTHHHPWCRRERPGVPSLRSKHALIPGPPPRLAPIAVVGDARGLEALEMPAATTVATERALARSIA